MAGLSEDKNLPPLIPSLPLRERMRVKENQKMIQITISNRIYRVELADNELIREQGLQFRHSLGSEEGMFFVFEQPDRHSFWMKDTFISLDILWISEDFRVIYIVQNTSGDDFTEEPSCYIPDQEALYVLEI